MKKNIVASCVLASLLVPCLCLAGHGGDAFAGGLAGGVLGGVVGGSIAKSGSSSKPDRATQERLDRLEAEQARREEAEKRKLEDENRKLREELARAKAAKNK